MPTITAADGTRLFVRDWGQGRPVVLVHGWPLSGEAWSSQALGLAESGFRVVTYDRRGFGRSDQPWSGYDYDTLSDDLAAIMGELGLDQAALVGFSMGGGELARYMSRHHGKGVARLAFVSSVAPGVLKGPDNPEGAPDSALESMKDGVRKDRAAFLRDFFETFYGQGTRGGGVSEAVLDWSFQMAMQGSIKATLDCIDAFGKTDFTADVAAIRCPTLAIHGTADKTVPMVATAHRLVKMLPGAELIEYDGAPHGLTATDADRLTRDLIAFLR